MKAILFKVGICLMAAGLGMAVGFGFRGKRGAEATAEEAAAAASAPADLQAGKSGLKARSFVRANDDSPLATKLQRDLAMSSGVTRWLYWMEAMEKATAPDFPRLFALAEGDAAASRLVSQRWIELYPRQLFDTMVAEKRSGRMSKRVSELSYSLFNEWSKRDPEAAIAALSGENVFGLSGPRTTVAGAVIEKDAELGLRLFSEWHIDSYGPRMNAVAKWAAADPRHAAEFALANPAGFATRLVMETVGKEWAKTAPAVALEFAAGKHSEFGAVLAEAVLKEWSGRNLNEAADWLAVTDERTRNRLSSALVEAWAKQDANAALAWCEANLAGSSLAQAVGGVMRGAAEKDVTAAAAMVMALHPSQARSEAATAVAKKWWPDRLGEDLQAKPAAIAWLNGLDGDSARRVVDEINWRWGTCDPKGMAAFLTASSESFGDVSYSIVARELARKSPMEAIAWASGLPEERGLSAGAEAFAEWRRTQPEAAAKWLDALPSSDARRQRYLESSIRVLAWDAQTATQLASLSAADRATARSVIQSMQLPEDRRVSLLEMLKSP